MDIDFKKLNDDELIDICIKKGVEYFNPKTKKNYAKQTLITRIKKLGETPKEEAQENKKEEVIIEYINEIIWKQSDEDKKNNDEYNDIEAKLISCIKSCHDILYSNGSITGLKASKDIIKIIICRLINVIYKNDVIKDIISTKISKDVIEEFEIYLIDIKEFCKVCNTDGNTDNKIKLFILEILIPIFPNIFNSDDIIFNTRNQPNNYIKIINKICELIDINDNELFIKLFAETGGNMYEYFTNSYGKGSTSKELGQFFTPFKLINLILFNIKDLIDINDDYTLYDPCCGSGGLLNRTASYLKINRNNIYGCEIESDTTKYALASLIVNNNSLQINILNRCSLSQNNYLFEDKKFDLILTNPPFGTKMTYKDLNDKFDVYKKDNYDSSQLNFNDIYPINTNNGASLFLQHVIYMLKDNGICGIVLPDGNELANKTYYNIRKYLIDNCKIIKVINVSGGTFGSTGVKTKVIIFKKQKGKDNDKNIEFLEINKECNELKLIATTNLDNNYSFRLKVKQDLDIYANKEVELIEFGEMFDLIKGTIQSSKVIEDINGDCVFINLSKNKEFKKIKEFELNNENIFISNVSPLGLIQYYNGKCCYSNLLYHIKSKDNYKDKINIKYIYYYLNRNQEFIEENYQLGCANKTLNIEEFNLMKIPIPSIEIQNKKVEEIDKLEESIKTIKLRMEQIKHEQQYILLSKIREYIDIEYKTLGKVCIINYGTRIVKDKFNKGEYDVYGGGDISFKIDNYNREGFNVIISRFAMSKNCVRLLNKKLFLNDNGLSIKSKYVLLSDKFLGYYLLSIQDYIYNCGRGTAQKAIDIDKFKLIKIPIPSIEIQKEIVDILDGINDRMNGDIKYIEVLRDLISKLI
jgi:type I restriction-modification system DNA methylase subunit